MAAELPPLETNVDERFSVHMVQHLLFCFVAAPLLVMARPGLAGRPHVQPGSGGVLEPTAKALGWA